MAKLRVKKFGPLNDGFSENKGFMEFRKLTVFIGEQGSGKSTIAKLYSTFLWLEKAFFCEFNLVNDFKTIDFIRLCSNQLLPDFYFTESTELEYIGEYCQFKFASGKFEYKKNVSETYNRPKIMYIPSERNLVSVLENVEGIKKLPIMLDLLQQEIRKAKKNFIPKISDKVNSLSLNNYSIKYDSSNDSIIIIEKSSNAAVPLTMSSSGLQSVIPLMIVTDFLSKEINKRLLDKLRDLSSAEREKLLNDIPDEAIKRNVEIYFISGLGQSKTESDIQKYEKAFSKYINSKFINIVEEPEQNLFPEYQKDIVESLILYANQKSENGLLITTHSPYVLGVLNNCMYAGNLTRRGKDCSDVISVNHQIPSSEVSAYKIEEGKIHSIISEELYLINNSEIDSCSESINSDYQKLEDIEFL